LEDQRKRVFREWLGRLSLIVPALVLLVLLAIRIVPTWRGQGNAVALRLGPLSFGWYGILIVSGAIAGALVGERQARRRGLDDEHIWNILLWGMVLGVVMARVWFILGELKYYFGDPARIIGVEYGEFVGLRGLALHGVLVGATLAALLYTWRKRLHFLTWMDVCIPGFPLGQAIGRWGNFFNQEAYGWRTTLPWGLRIGAEFRIDAVHYVDGVRHILPEYSKLALGSPQCSPGLACYTNLAMYPETTRFHPTFLYESLWNLAVCLFLLWLARRYGQRLVRGEILWVYGLLYAAGRFANEFLRVDSEYVGTFPAPQVSSVVLFLICAGFLVGRRWLWKKPTYAESP